MEGGWREEGRRMEEIIIESILYMPVDRFCEYFTFFCSMQFSLLVTILFALECHTFLWCVLAFCLNLLT